MPAATPPGLHDREVLAAVRAVLAAEGSCSYRALARQLGVPYPTAYRWCRPLIADGRLVAGSGAASLRPAPRRARSAS